MCGRAWGWDCCVFESACGRATRQRRLDGEVVAERTPQSGVAIRHAHLGDGDVPFARRAAAVEDVVESFGIGVGRAWVDGDLASSKFLSSRFAPSPGVKDAVACGTVFVQAEVRVRDRVASLLLRFIMSGSEGGVRVEDAPDVENGGVRFYDSVRKR